MKQSLNNLKSKELWLSRQQDGSYLLTEFKPVRKQMINADFDWLYPIYGEPINVEYCENGVHNIFRIELKEFESIKIKMNVGILK